MWNQYLDSIEKIIKERKSVFTTTNAITERNKIPSNWNYPLKNNQWYKIKDVICVFVDMRNSTVLNAETYDKSTASVYEFFTWTAIRFFHDFWASYIDIKWDWVFALFNHDEVFKALAAAITFKTFAGDIFMKKMKRKFPTIDVGFHMWIDQKVVLVKQIWLKDDVSRDSRKNEVWAWKPINMAAKLSSKSKDRQLLISERFYKKIKNEELVTKSCWCKDGEKSNETDDLWTEIDVSDDNKYDFNKAYLLESEWCSNHGEKWCKDILNLD